MKICFSKYLYPFFLLLIQKILIFFLFSVGTLLDGSKEEINGGVGMSSPAYSHISNSSTRPNSAAPMDVDFDSAMDVSSLSPFNSIRCATPLTSNTNECVGG